MVETEFQRFRSLVHTLKDYRNAILITLIWILSSILSENSVLTSINQIIRFFLYPINFVLYRTDFSLTKIPSIFILLIPLLLVFLVGFLYLISTED